MRAARRLVLLAVLPLALGACKKEEPRPAAGLHSAAATLFLVTAQGKRPLAVGSVVQTTDRLAATGPALLEFFSGAVRFLERGDEVEVGELQEAKLVSTNFPQRAVRKGELIQVPSIQRLIPPRYADSAVTPAGPPSESETTTNDYFRAFFTPHGMENLGNGSGASSEGPRKPLPPPPFREKVIRIHAAPLGTWGPTLEVSGDPIAAETEELATAILLPGEKYDLGRIARLVLPAGARAKLHLVDGAVIKLDGPADVHFR